MVQPKSVTVTSVLTVVFYLSGEIIAECIHERPQWILQLGLRDISSSLKPNQPAKVSQSEIASTSRTIDQKIICGTSSENKFDDAVKKSQLPLQLVGNKYYYFGTYFKANFFQAMQFCEVHGMNLLSIESNIENDAIITYLKANYASIENFWTSGTDLGLEGEFVWLSTGKQFNFTYWSSSQPDNAGKSEHCLHLWKIKVGQYIWNDVICTNTYNFICEPKPCTNLCANDS